ncbi:MAG: 50S ribosomal protein L4 [Patescibacteria group bacterium]|nr:MAG: 50S ribosomal protein L4 [Patescibacteria group bacterium]
MPRATVKSKQGGVSAPYWQKDKVNSIELDKDVFNSEINEYELNRYIYVYRTNQRKGTADTKTRGQVSGSTRKIYSQKKMGRARHGDIKAPIFVGGGVVFGPQSKVFNLKINKKQKRLAMVSALSLKQKANQLVVLDDEVLAGFKKTKEFVKFLTDKQLNGKKLLIITSADAEDDVFKPIRNVKEVICATVDNINPYILMLAENVMITKSGLEILQKRYNKNEN